MSRGEEAGNPRVFLFFFFFFFYPPLISVFFFFFSFFFFFFFCFRVYLFFIQRWCCEKTCTNRRVEAPPRSSFFASERDDLEVSVSRGGEPNPFLLRAGEFVTREKRARRIVLESQARQGAQPAARSPRVCSAICPGEDAEESDRLASSQHPLQSSRQAR